MVSRPGGNENSFIQYWLLYYANDHAEMFHEGDWEVVQVDLDGNLKPYTGPTTASMAMDNGETGMVPEALKSQALSLTSR